MTEDPVVFLSFTSIYFVPLSSQFRDPNAVFPATLNFKVSSYGHISTNRKHNMHCEVVTSPPFSSNTSVTWVWQTRLQAPHFVHFSSSFPKCTPETRLKGGNLLNIPINPPLLNRKYCVEIDIDVVAC